MYSILAISIKSPFQCLICPKNGKRPPQGGFLGPEGITSGRAKPRSGERSKNQQKGGFNGDLMLFYCDLMVI